MAEGGASILRQEAVLRGQQGSPISRRILMPAPQPRNFLRRVPKGQLGRALFPFEARHNDEVSLRFNEQVVVLDARDAADDGPTQRGELPPGWLEVQLQGSSRAQGRVPAAYVEFTGPVYGAEATILFDVAAQDESGQYLELAKGDAIVVTAWNADGWHSAFHPKSFQYGVVPNDYFELENPASYQELEDLLIEFDGNELPFLNYLGEAVDVSSTDALCKDLLMLFNTKGLVVDLLRSSIESEVKTTTSEGTLFRKNSISTHLMSMYARLLGKRYLKDTLRPLIVHVLSCQGSFEIDPHRIADDEDINKNVQTLKLSAQKFLHQVMESVNTVPLCLRLICQALQQTVRKRFPAAARKAVGGFYFLRFICPAIVSPEGFGVIDKLEPRGRRSLILMSKIVQTLSNGVMFGAKEAFMIPMNDFIRENLENVHFVLDKLATVPPNYDPAEVDRLPTLPEGEVEELRKRLHVAVGLTSKKMIKAMRAEGNETLARAVQELNARLGPLPDRAKLKRMELINANDRRVSTKLVLSDFVKDGAGGAPAPGGALKGRKGAPVPWRPPKKIAKSAEDPVTAAAKGKKFKPKSLEDNPLPMCMSFLFKKRPGKKLWNKRFFVCYMRGDAIHYYQGPEDMPQKIQGSIDLATDGTAAFILGDRSRKGNPSGWEFYIKGPTCGVIHFVASDEDTMRQWISCIDRRTRELRQPTGATHPLRALLSSLEAKQDGFQQQLQEHQNALKSSSDASERSLHSQKIEELTLNISEVKRSIAIAKAT